MNLTWLKLGEILGRSFYNNFGNSAPDTWVKVIEEMGQEKVQNALENLLQFKGYFDLREFINLGRKAGKHPSHKLFLPLSEHDEKMKQKIRESNRSKIVDFRKNLNLK